MLHKTSWPEKSSVSIDAIIQQYNNTNEVTNDVWRMLFDDKICRSDWERIVYEAIEPHMEKYGMWHPVDKPGPISENQEEYVNQLL